jgi:hypothetical protein
MAIEVGTPLILKHAYGVGVKYLPDGQSALQLTRNQLYRMGIGAH